MNLCTRTGSTPAFRHPAYCVALGPAIPRVLRVLAGHALPPTPGRYWEIYCVTSAESCIRRVETTDTLNIIDATEKHLQSSLLSHREVCFTISKPLVSVASIIKPYIYFSIDFNWRPRVYNPVWRPRQSGMTSQMVSISWNCNWRHRPCDALDKFAPYLTALSAKKHMLLLNHVWYIHG